ncbi:MAG: PQQ-binding-like beta-propeller repeat protein [Verrucomicrobiota bacterium]|nr:PQQ-binding-like beta-propeller repeat protein [Verrucomicrobiota bacterium]
MKLIHLTKIGLGGLAGLAWSLAGTVTAENWPTWRGPAANGVAPGGNPPTEFSESKNIQWKTKVPGSGSSTPVIWGDQVFVITAEKTGKKVAAAGGESRERGQRPDGERPEGRGRGEQGSRGGDRPRPDGDRGSRGGERPRPDGERSQRGGQSGSGGGSFNREEFIKRFDKNGDGELNDAERDAMRDELRQQFGGGRGGERSPRSGRSSRGRGGFGGGSKPTEEYRYVLMSLDRNTGKENWRRVAATQVPHEGHHRDHGYASGSPVTDGEHIIVSFGSRGLYCYDMKGKLQWKKDFGDMRMRNSFGEGTSPALHGDTVVLLWDHEGDSALYALDKKTGKLKWKTDRNEASGWCTPVVTVHDGLTQVIVNGTRAVRSYQLSDGKLLWQCSGQTSNAIPSIVVDENFAYAMSGFRGAYLAAIKLGGSGDLTDSKSVSWTANRGTPYTPSPLLSNGRIWYLSGNNGILSVRDTKSGKLLVEGERLDGVSGVYASPVSAGGRVYIAGRNGTVSVLKDSAKLEVLATNELDEKFDCSPAVVGKQMFLRGKEHLYCIATK